MADSSTDIGASGTAERRRYVRFDPQINTGHILQIAVLTAGIFGAWATVDKRVSLLERAHNESEARVREGDGRMRDSLADMKIDMKDLRRSVEHLNLEVRAQSLKLSAGNK